jgi:tetrahydromethanopterin S-methyltransferase subunit G
MHPFMEVNVYQQLGKQLGNKIRIYQGTLVMVFVVYKNQLYVSAGWYWASKNIKI